MSRFLLLAVLVVTLAAFVLAGGAAAAGPQRLPDGACNQGTETAHTEGAGGAESIAHLPPPPGPE
jgi:hypothetical protein